MPYLPSQNLIKTSKTAAQNRGEYAAVFDPLDGSANIEAGLPCGTIFGILRVSGSAREGQKAGPSTIVLPGRRLVAAGYCLYGPSTKLVFTLGAGVFEFTLLGEGQREEGEGGLGDDGGLGGGGLEFVLTRSNMRIPRSGHVSVFCLSAVCVRVSFGGGGGVVGLVCIYFSREKAEGEERRTVWTDQREDTHGRERGGGEGALQELKIKGKYILSVEGVFSEGNALDAVG